MLYLQCLIVKYVDILVIEAELFLQREKVVFIVLAFELGLSLPNVDR